MGMVCLYMLSNDGTLRRVLGFSAERGFPVDGFICMLALSSMVLACRRGLTRESILEASRYGTGLNSL